MSSTAADDDDDNDKLKQVVHIKLLFWFEFFRTIALLLGALRDLIAGYSKSS